MSPCKSAFFATLMVFLWAAGWSMPVRAQDAVLTIAYPEFYPFFEKTPGGKPRGFFYEIVTRALEDRMKIPTQWRSLPWKRCQSYVRFGKYDAMITVPTAERLAYADTHPTPFYQKKMALFTYRGHERLPRIEAIKDAGDIKTGDFTVITYSGNGWHENNIEGLGVPSLEVADVHLVWSMLAARRGDLVIEWPVGAYAGMEKAGVRDDVVETGAWLKGMNFHLLIGKKSRFVAILPRFNRVIEAMIADGTIEEILFPYTRGKQ